MKAIDLRKQLKPYKKGWVAIDKNHKVVAQSNTLESLSFKIRGIKDLLLIPASDNYKGFITSA